MSAHTPGPWHVHVAKSKAVTGGLLSCETLTGASHGPNDYIAVVGADGNVVCDNANYYATAISEEDAPLIAAAPELLALLQEARTYIDGCGAEGGGGALVEAIDAAIAKATGGAA